MGLDDKTQPFLGSPLHDGVGGEPVGMPRCNLVAKGTFYLRETRAGLQLQQIKGALQIVHDTLTILTSTSEKLPFTGKQITSQRESTFRSAHPVTSPKSAILLLYNIIAASQERHGSGDATNQHCSRQYVADMAGQRKRRRHDRT